jgi:hypothetical protein
LTLSKKSFKINLIGLKNPDETERKEENRKKKFRGIHPALNPRPISIQHYSA